MIDFDAIIREINNALELANGPALIAIDGDAAAGKTTLATHLGQHFACPVVPMDHFFLPPDMRSEARLAQPGSNIHHERFKQEVLNNLIENKPFSYKPFDCKIWDFTDEITINPGKLTIVEGSYSLHPTLADAYHLKIFLKVDKQTQMQRIKQRKIPIEMMEKFENIWIPMEKLYHETFGIEESCNIVI